MSHLEERPKFGRDVWKVLILGEKLMMASFYSDYQVNLMKSQIEPRRPQIILIDTLLRTQPHDHMKWQMLVNIQMFNN